MMSSFFLTRNVKEAEAASGTSYLEFNDGITTFGSYPQAYRSDISFMPFVIGF